MQGFIKLHRKMLDNPIVCKDSDHLAVWTYILLNATHKEYPAMFQGEKIILQPGQLITGRKVISEKFKISESKVQRILKLFENEHQIEQQNGNKNRLITVVSWLDYQNSEHQDEQLVNNKRTTTEQQLNTNKNVKNDENEKNDNKVVKKKNARHKSGEFDSEKSNYADYVWLKPEEYQKLVDLHGLEATTEMIEILNSYKASSGKKYPSDYHTMVGRGWVLDKYKDEQAKKFKVYKGGAGQQKQSAFSRLQQLAMEESEREASGNY